jgi:phosphoribosylglycinamide formyltransferase 2
VEIRIFGKPTTRKHRRMGVALASAETTDAARQHALRAAGSIKIDYES